MLKPKKQQDQQNQQNQAAQHKQDEQHQQESKPDVPPKLPPTHPLATGQHSDKQAAVPLAGAGAGAGATQDAGSSSIANAVDAQYHKSADDNNDKAPVSPVGPTPISKDNRTVSEPVSAISADEDKPLPVPKTETAPVTADKTETTGMQLLRQSTRTSNSLTRDAQHPSYRKPHPQPPNPLPAKTSNPTALRLPPPLHPPPPHPQSPKSCHQPKSPPNQAAPLLSTRRCPSWQKSRQRSRPKPPLRA
jgi:hypothetical protein